MKKVLNILGTIAIVGVFAFLAYLKWWNVAGAGTLGDSCKTRAGCRSVYCLEHELVNKVEKPSEGYCTASCDADKDCMTGFVCVVPTQAALDDLPSHGQPSKLCERIR